MSLEMLIDADDSRLRETCAEADASDPDLNNELSMLHKALSEFRQQHGFGRAIAAPQLGIMKRMVALNLGATPFELINPEIYWRSEETQQVWDDCLSLPDIVVNVNRHKSVSIRYQDIRGQHHQWHELPADLAELVQHEIDHLNGILMTDRAIDEQSVRPVSDHAQLVSGNRPKPRLSLTNTKLASTVIDPVFLNSPQYNCEPLSDVLNCKLTLKLEFLNPIRSFKGRGASFLLHQLAREYKSSVIPPLFCATAGNWGQALAYCCRSAGLPLTIYAAENANEMKIERMRALGASVVLEGEDFDTAKDAAAQQAKQHSGLLLEDGKFAAVSEATATIAMELQQQKTPFDAIVVPLGGGALLAGIARWMKASAPSTRIIGVSASGADAMYQSWHQQKLISTDTVNTIADGIAMRVPVAEALGDIQNNIDDIVLVDDAEIISAMQLLRTHTGLLAEPAGACALSAIKKEKSFSNQRVAAIICGSNLTEAQIKQFELN